MNPLLQKIPRKTERVELESRPDLTLYVRALTAAELMDLWPRVDETRKDRKANTAVQLEAYVSDADGAALLALGEGASFIECISGLDMQRLMQAGDSLNVLSDKKLEEAEKN